VRNFSFSEAVQRLVGRGRQKLIIRLRVTYCRRDRICSFALTVRDIINNISTSVMDDAARQ